MAASEWRTDCKHDLILSSNHYSVGDYCLLGFTLYCKFSLEFSIDSRSSISLDYVH